MKRTTIKKAVATIMALALSWGFFASESYAQSNQRDYVSISGSVVNATTNDPLVFATVSVADNNVATVTNIDGEFLLKVYNANSNTRVIFSYLGYENKQVLLSELRDNRKNRIGLNPKEVSINQITIRPGNPEEIVMEMLRQRKLNYANEPNLMTAFFRETIKKRRNYVGISEAAVRVFKAPYDNDFRMDMVKIYKGRKSNDVEKMDTVLFRLQGGPHTTLYLDLMKNPNMNFGADYVDLYNYDLVDITIIDDKPHYVIDFSPKPDVELPIFMGTYFIEAENLGLREARFSMDLTNIAAARNIFIRKKPLGISVTPETANYVVKYREQDGKWYFSYSRAEVKFIVDYDKKLFNTNYTTMSEIAITDRTTEQVDRFQRDERLKRSVVFSEKVQAFTNDDFWGDYNVIEPDAAIETAIRKLSRKLLWQEKNEND